jgi:hypothetical protein
MSNMFYSRGQCTVKLKMTSLLQDVQTFSSPLMLEAHRTDDPRDLANERSFTWENNQPMSIR